MNINRVSLDSFLLPAFSLSGLTIGSLLPYISLGLISLWTQHCQASFGAELSTSPFSSVIPAFAGAADDPFTQTSRLVKFSTLGSGSVGLVDVSTGHHFLRAYIVGLKIQSMRSCNVTDLHRSRRVTCWLTIYVKLQATYKHLSQSYHFSLEVCLSWVP